MTVKGMMRSGACSCFECLDVFVLCTDSLCVAVPQKLGYTEEQCVIF